MRKDLIKKTVAISIVASMATATFTGCKSDDESQGALNIFIWTEYVPESVIEGFKTETGIDVNVSYYSSNEDLYSKMKSEKEGTYDIVLPSDYMVEKLIEQDMVQPLDYDLIPNASNVYDAYLDASYDPGNIYSLPYSGGVAAIAVNTDKVDIEVKGYDDLFDQSIQNCEVVLDDSRAVIGMTAASLGYSMSTSDPSELSEIEEKLMTLKDKIKVYDSDSPKTVLVTGDCSLGMIWNPEVALAMDEVDSIEIVYPEEGAYVFIDSWLIPKGAKNTDEAHAFINYLLEGENFAACLAELPYLNPNEAAAPLLGDEYINNPAKNIPQEVIANGEYIQNLDTETQAIYEEMWTKLKQ